MKEETTFASLPRDALLQAVQTVLGIVERRHTLPILNHLLLQGDAQGLQLTASDLQCQLSTGIALDSDPDSGTGGASSTSSTSGTTRFGLTVAAHKLADILRALPPGAPLRLARSRGRVSLHSGRSRFTLQTLPAADFPLVQATAPTVQLQLPPAVLLALLDAVAFAMASHDIRHYLNGVLIVAEPGQLSAVATDGNRLALSQAPLATPAGPGDTGADRLEFILPRKTVGELQRLLRGRAGGTLQLALSSAQAVFTVDGVRFISQLIEGRFPDYRRVVPPAPPHSVLLDRALLRAALERAALMTSDKFRGVRLLLQPGSLQVSASNAAHEDALEEIDVDYAGPPLAIGLNVGYLIDLLVLAGKDEGAVSVQMALQDAQSSVLFTRPDEPGFCYVVSPMRM